MTARPAHCDRLRRSAHFVPGGNERMLQKSLETQADSLVLDLEDAVAPERKAEARQAVAAWLEDADFGRQERIVRINPLDTPWGLEDLQASMRHPPDIYMVPKVSTADELRRIDQTLAELERRHGHPSGALGLIVIATETPLSVLNLPTFAQCPRVAALTWGAEDLSAALGAPRSRRPDGEYLDLYKHCRCQTLLCAAAGGVQPLDTVFVDFRDPEALRRDCQESVWLGYTGRLTIHPAQIDIVNQAFSPDPEAVAESERLLAAFEEAKASGRMAFRFEGRMVDAPHLARAERILERAKAIRARQAAPSGAAGSG